MNTISILKENNASTSFQQNLYAGLRQSPGIEIVEDGGSIAEIQPPSSTTQSRELSRNSSVKILLKRCTRRDVILIGAAGLMLTFIGQLSIPLPFTPIPITFRLQGVLLLSILLGSQRTLLAVGLFLALSTPLLLGPSAGYIVGYLLAAVAVKSDRPVYSFVVGSLLVYACGFAYLSTLIGMQKAFLLGIAPFIFGDIMKSIIALKIVRNWPRIK